MEHFQDRGVCLDPKPWVGDSSTLCYVPPRNTGSSGKNLYFQRFFKFCDLSLASTVLPLVVIEKVSFFMLVVQKKTVKVIFNHDKPTCFLFIVALALIQFIN